MRLHILPLSCTLFIAMLIFSGCGLKNDIITINYTPYPSAQMVNGADAVGVRVSGADKRKIKENVGKKGDEYSALGAIIAQNDIADTVAKALESELERRGFKLAKGAVEVYLEIIKFYNVFKGFNEKAIAELIMNVQVKDANGGIVYTDTVIGEGIKSGIMMRTGDNAKVALEAALKHAVSQLVTDKKFISALFKAAQ
jgi:uncharacterized lipoprotein YajG